MAMRSVWVAAIAITSAVAPACAADAPVDFARDVRPILRAACYDCHGPDKQKADLRLDSREVTLKGGKTGPAILAGKGSESLLIKRIKGEGDDTRMPPKKPSLKDEQIALIQRWIDQGAVWPDAANIADAKINKHWAYQPPVRPDVPKVSGSGWVRNPIDAFILARLEKENLKPAPEAGRATLIRRLSLDLTGLPPLPAEVDAFVADESPNAYANLVERLLASPHYGERWARPWMDLARYADTNGYEADRARLNWLWRDWVIQSLNADLPYDQFTLEQMAGDLLPNATDKQKIATGFHRNSLKNEEGGVDQGEQRWLVNVDRLNTTATVWLGQTIACAQCHDHKYDPFSQKEYYQLLAFFENADEPTISVPRPGLEKEHAKIADKVKLLEDEMTRLDKTRDDEFQAWQKLEYVKVAFDRDVKKRLDDIRKANPQLSFGTPKPASKLPPKVFAVLDLAPEKRTDPMKRDLRDHFRTLDPQMKPMVDAVAALKKDLTTKEITSLVLKEKDAKGPLKSVVRVKGMYLSKGEEVTANFPAALHRTPTTRPTNRLDLARWLVDPANPLTARVHVNRLWETYFGRGLVETSEDLGTQGATPTHPELLDWLATEFIRQNWSMKAMHRLIVTSSTYRMSSRVPPGLLEKDRYNLLLARAPRYRLEGEMIRDAALAASGLLSRKIGGPSVMPYQPEGVWNVPYSGEKWTTSAGDDRYRRGLYVYWRRSAPYPAMLAFDGTSRESCTVRRIRTNTPLAALVGLNDPAFFEAAQAMARRLLREGGNDDAARAAYAMKLVVSRDASEREVNRLLKLLAEQRVLYAKDVTAAKAAHGPLPLPDKAAAADAAAWTMVCNVLLNLDEALTRE
jgi:hypothetical protein